MLDKLMNDLKLEMKEDDMEEETAQKAYESQMKLKEEKKQMDKAEEDKFRAQLMAKFAEDDRIEQLNDQKRRMKIQTHKREVERLLREKQLMYEAEREAEVEEQRKGRDEEAR